MAVDEARIARIAADNARIADTAKWLSAGLAGLGGLLIAGLQLASLGALDDPTRITAAAAGGVVAFACFVAATLATVSVLLPVRLTLPALAAREAGKGGADPVVAWIHANRGGRVLRAPNDTLAELDHDYDEALAKRREALRAYHETPNATTKAEAKRRTDRALELNGVVGELLAEAAHRETRQSWQNVLLVLPALGVGALLGILALAWALTEPAQDPVDLRGADLSGELRDAELRGAVLDGMKITGADLTGTFLGEASHTQTVWTRVTCPDGTLSDDAGKTCAGHLEP